MLGKSNVGQKSGYIFTKNMSCEKKTLLQKIFILNFHSEQWSEIFHKMNCGFKMEGITNIRDSFWKKCIFYEQRKLFFLSKGSKIDGIWKMVLLMVNTNEEKKGM